MLHLIVCFSSFLVICTALLGIGLLLVRVSPPASSRRLTGHETLGLVTATLALLLGSVAGTACAIPDVGLPHVAATVIGVGLVVKVGLIIRSLRTPEE